MAAESLAFRTAKQHVQTFSDESSALMKAHAEAMDCRDCEAFLQLGIDAFEWLMRADRIYRMDIYRGEGQHDATVENALRALCKAWLEPCAFADRWIEAQRTRGFVIDNLVRFRQCVDEMAAIVEAWDGDTSLPQPIADLRDAAIIEHRNGETAEFI
jgi:hypothetical protein